MKYETIDGRIIDTDSNQTILRFLRIGDKFRTKSSKDTFEVWDDRCKYNGNAGSSTRKCKNLTTGQFEHKLCRNTVTKI